MRTFLLVLTGNSFDDACLVATIQEPMAVADILTRVTVQQHTNGPNVASINTPGMDADTRAQEPTHPPACLYYTPAEAYSLIGIGRTSMYRLLREGRIPAKRLGKKWLIPRSVVENFSLEEAQNSDQEIAP